MVSLKKFNRNDDIKKINKALEEDGCVVIENIIAHELLSRLKTELDTHFAKTKNCKGNFYGFYTKRLSGLVEKSNVVKSLCINPLILSVMDEFLLRGCSEYQLNLTQAIRIGHEEPQQIIHRDDAMFPFQHASSEAMINCMYAIDEFTEDNGATVIVPKSHKWEVDRQPEEHEITKGTMKAGSVLIYFGSLLHGGGANKTLQPRTGMVLSYNLGWLKQAENQFLATPVDVISSLPERLQRLIGYFVHTPNLGCVDGQNPRELLCNNKNENRFVEFLPDEVKPFLQEYRQDAIKRA